MVLDNILSLVQNNLHHQKHIITFANITADINARVKFKITLFPHGSTAPSGPKRFLVVDASRSHSVRNTAFNRNSLDE